MTQGQNESLPVEVIDRLRRIEGQVRGLQKMMKQRRAPSEVIYQIAAVKSALEQAALQYLWWEAQQRGTMDDVAHEVHTALQLIAKIL
ncbi:MAG: metal-sensitive transcriptional regulator [Armatimonadota bacterium]